MLILATDSGYGRKDPLHGVTLQNMLDRLVERYGWDELGLRLRIKCFSSDPSTNSCLKFLRKTPWARQKVEALYLQTHWPAVNVWRKTPQQHGD